MIDVMKILGSMMSNNATSSRGGNQILNDLLGGLGGMGGRGGRGGMGSRGQTPVRGGTDPTMALLGSLAGAAMQYFMQNRSSSGGSPLGVMSDAGAMGLAGAPAMDTAQANDQAMVLLQAMINAAKADGEIDPDERQRIVERISDITPEESQFIQQELSGPLNLDFVAGVGLDMATQVYAVSLMAIHLDTEAELKYLHLLAQRLGLDAQTVNQIHQQLGIKEIYG